MASKTVSAKKKPTTAKSTEAKPAETKPTDPEVAILRSATCPTLSRSGNIGYEISTDDTGAILFRLISNSGSGYFNSKVRVSFNDILDTLKRFGKSHPISSLALKDVYPANSSINNWSFLMSALLSEKVVEAHPEHPRCYRLCTDPDAFLSSLDKLKAPHTQPGKGSEKAKAKAESRMQKGKAKPAIGE